MLTPFGKTGFSSNLTRPAAKSRPASYIFCFCFLFIYLFIYIFLYLPVIYLFIYFLTIPAGPIISKSTGPIC